jgi:hypothetical protein
LERRFNISQEPAPLFWTSNSNNVGFWPGTINVSAQVHGPITGNVTRNFVSMVDNSRSTWSRALGVPINRVANPASAQIRAFGGQREYMNRLSLQMRPHSQPGATWAGWAFYATDTEVDSVRISGAIRSIRRFSNYSPNFNVCGWGMQQSQSLITHEIGHSLGWWGHSSSNIAVMYSSMRPEASSPNGVLTVAESRHLRQIYDRYR